MDESTACDDNKVLVLLLLGPQNGIALPILQNFMLRISMNTYIGLRQDVLVRRVRRILGQEISQAVYILQNSC